MAGAGGVSLWRVGGCPGDGARDPSISLSTPGVVNQSIAASDDGRVAAGGSDGIIRVWHRVPPARPSSPPDRALEGHTGAVTGLGFSPDGELLASASDDRTARIYGCPSCGDLESAVELGRGLMPKAFGQ